MTRDQRIARPESPSTDHRLLLAVMWLLLPIRSALRRKHCCGTTRQVSDSAESWRQRCRGSGALGTRMIQARPYDRRKLGAGRMFRRLFETSFLPGSTFTSPTDLNT